MSDATDYASLPTKSANRFGRTGRLQFIAAVVVLGVAAVTLNAITQKMQLHFKKIPVPIRHQLDDRKNGLPARIGPWQMVSIDTPLDHDYEENLGTKQYVFRDYVDARLVGEADLAKFEGKSVNERRHMLGQLQQRLPKAVINIGVTYYTGLVDTVPHIPEGCYVAAGYQPTNPIQMEWDVKSPLLPAGAKLPVRFAEFDDNTGTQVQKRNVAYFFQTQGEYEGDPLQVRFRMQNLLQRHNYFSKVELMTQTVPRDESVAIMQDFLRVGLPEVERCLPDFAALMRQEGGNGGAAAPAVAGMK